MKTRQEITKEFIATINRLVDDKKVRNKREIIDALDWDETALSNVIAGKRDVPERIARKLYKIYKVKTTGIPIYDLKVSATPAETYHDENELPSFTVSVPGYEDCNFGMYVYGNSMHPTIENGSLILCKKVSDKQIILWGEIYVVLTGDYRMVKRLQRCEKKNSLTCISDNEELRKSHERRFEPIEIERDKIRELYLVKGIIKKTQS